MTKDDFEFLYIIGKGGFGNVWKVKNKETGKYYALKQMEKAKIIDQNSERNILQERLFLSKMNDPFLVNMLCSFQDKDHLYLVLQLFTGGDLRYHLTNYIYSFTETQLKFLLSNIVLGLQYIHSKGILHRDLKPENILFDDKGYAYITDFGIAWSNDEDHEGDNSGTPGYMAPETLFGLKQDYCVDFYSLGVIGYEIIMTKTPYDGNSRHEIKKQMHEKNVYIDYDEAENFSDICIDFINGLLVKNPAKRLGVESGVSEIKANMFFRGMNWELIYNHKYLSPIVDIIKFAKTREGDAEELFDVEYCQRKDSSGNSTLERYSNIRNGRYYSKYFRNYSIICVDNILRELPKKKRVQIIKRVPVNEQNNAKNNEQMNSNSMIANNKILRRSRSIANDIVYPNINGINEKYAIQQNEQKKVNDNDMQNHHYHHNEKKIYRNLSRSVIKKIEALKLPQINNKIIKKGQEREKKIKKYYENKLGKYRTVLKKLHSNYIKKANELNKQNKIYQDRKYKLLEKKYEDLKNKQKYQTLKNHKTVIVRENPPLPHNYNNNNMNYNGYTPNIPSNNCNFYNCNSCNHCNCNNFTCNNGCNHCNLCFGNNLNHFDYKKFYDKMSKNRDNFFFKYNNDTDSEENECECECEDGDTFCACPCDRGLYEQNLIERGRLIPRTICRNKMRYITMGRDGPCVEVVETSTDEEEEDETDELIEIREIEERPPPIP